MEKNVLKTIQWSESEMVFKPLALKKFGRAKSGKTTDFAAFVRAYPRVNSPKMAAFWAEIAKCNGLTDVTSMALISEDSCLFSCGPATALEIILRHLKTLNTGGKVKALWSFIDDDKRAVVHFINQEGWYAEAFFACNEDFSVLHVLEENGGFSFVPIVFAKDISAAIAQAEASGEVFLQEYLPREAHDFLSNKSGQKKDIAMPTDKSTPEVNSFFQTDGGDLL